MPTPQVEGRHDDLALLQGDLATPFTPVTDEEAAAVLGAQFGIKAGLTRFSTEKDDTFRCDTPDDQSYVLKIANPQEKPVELSLQVEVMRHIEKTAPALPIPRVLPSVSGDYLPAFQARSGETRQVRLMSFMPGTPLDRSIASAHGREQIGELLARLRLATADFSHPGESRAICWDVQNLLKLEPLLAFVDDPIRRRQLQTGLERFEHIEDVLASCRKQVLHNDFNTSNIVVDPQSPTFVTGIIDFGDAVKTAVAIDVSTALMNQLGSPGPNGDQDIFTPAREVLTGYLRCADLTPVELALIPHLAMGRLVARALLTNWRSQLFKHNSAYILRNAEPGWAQLDWILKKSPEQISELLMTFAD